MIRFDTIFLNDHNGHVFRLLAVMFVLLVGACGDCGSDSSTIEPCAAKTTRFESMQVGRFSFSTDNDVLHIKSEAARVAFISLSAHDEVLREELALLEAEIVFAFANFATSPQDATRVIKALSVRADLPVLLIPAGTDRRSVWTTMWKGAPKNIIDVGHFSTAQWGADTIALVSGAAGGDVLCPECCASSWPSLSEDVSYLISWQAAQSALTKGIANVESSKIVLNETSVRAAIYGFPWLHAGERHLAGNRIETVVTPLGGEAAFRLDGKPVRQDPLVGYFDGTTMSLR